MQPQVIYLLLVVVAVVLLAAMTTNAWRYRRAPGIGYLVLIGVSSGVWAGLVGAMALASPAGARVLLSVKYLAIGAASVSAFLFVAGRAGRLTRLAPWQVAAFMIVPIAGHLMSWRDGWGMIRDVSFARTYELTHVSAIALGPGYWVFTGYLYALVLASISFLVVAHRQGPSIARTQSVPLLVGVTTPLLTNVLLITGIASRTFDPMPLGLAMSGMALWWGTVRGGILDLVPVARNVLVDSLADGIVILDHEERVLDVNRRFADITGVAAGTIIGRTLVECPFPDATFSAVLRKAAATARPADTEGATPPRQALALGDRWFDLQTLAVPGRASSAAARLVVLHDVTERQRWQDEQARLIGDLQMALGQVKTLSGLLPICSGCKQIRDGGGAWHQLEVYIRDRTNAEFTHGMCPACVARWYPELAEPSRR